LYNIRMAESSHLGREFFERTTPLVARSLLGMRLVRVDNGSRISGLIIEAEAYQGEQDQGCHARVGRTHRTQVMYGPPGTAYVYFTYGMHWMLNFVTEQQGFPAAVLIRAILPLEGLAVIAARRSRRPQAAWVDGPGKLCQALNIDKRLNGCDICAPDAQLFVEAGTPVPDSGVTSGPRVGLNSVPEPWKSIPWRFRVQDTHRFIGRG
jgi:DNA-3-methyladenine glycosylase